MKKNGEKEDMESKQWKMMCDEVFCAWLKFESDEYEASIELSKRGMLLWFWKGMRCYFYSIHRSTCSDCEFAKFLDYFNQYSTNEVLDNIDFQEEKQAEMMSAVEREIMSTEGVF